MYSLNKTFFSQKEARAFAEYLKKNGVTKIELSIAKGAFNQTEYRVAWNID